MISVIITVHEPLLEHLQRCVSSVLWQMRGEDELIIVGDKVPTEVLARYAPYDEALVYVGYRTMQRDGVSGASATRNLGLAHAAQQWVKFLDADDLLAPFALNAFRHMVEKNRVPEDVAMVCGSMVRVHNDAVEGVVDAADIDAVITRANPALPSMCFVRRAAANAVNGFDERIDFEEDWDFWLRLRAAKFRFARTLTPFCYYVIDDAARAQKNRTHQVDGMDVRDYLAKTYGINPQK